MSADIEAYVSGTDCDAVLKALREKLGALELSDEIDKTSRIYASGDVRIVLNSGVQDGFISVYITLDAAPWKTDVEFARFLAKRLNCRVRCSPPADYSHINPYSDYFLEINGGRESVVEWIAPGGAQAGDASREDLASQTRTGPHVNRSSILAELEMVKVQSLSAFSAELDRLSVRIKSAAIDLQVGITPENGVILALVQSDLRECCRMNDVERFRSVVAEINEAVSRREAHLWAMRRRD